MAPTWTTASEYRERSCNQCGQCCEKFSLTLKPLALVVYAARERFTPATIAWLQDLLPLDERDAWGQQLYRCLRFERDAAAHGRCTRYDERPEQCSVYPFPHQPSAGVAPPIYARCSWYVNIIPIQSAVAAEATALVKGDQPSSAAPQIAEAVG